MSRPTDRTTFRRRAQTELPFTVAIEVPPHGLGLKLNQMLDWCRARMLSTDWAQHGMSKKRQGEVPRDFAVFYFRSERDADDFRKAWAP